MFICDHVFFLCCFKSVDLDFIVGYTEYNGDFYEFKFVFEDSNGIICNGFDVIMECSSSNVLYYSCCEGERVSFSRRG